MKKLIKFNFSKKGIDVVNSNINAINSSLSMAIKIILSEKKTRGKLPRV